MTTLTDSLYTAAQLVASADPQLLDIASRSLAVSAMATLLACSVGLVIGAWLGVARFAGREVVLAILNTLLSLPSVVVGLLIYLLLSRSGPLGYLGWLFSFKAMVLAQTCLILPVLIALARWYLRATTWGKLSDLPAEPSMWRKAGCLQTCPLVTSLMVMRCRTITRRQTPHCRLPD